MKVLIAYASKYGATTEIVQRMAARLTERGLEVQALPAGAVDDLTGYDAFIVGSAVYIGAWLKDATRFVERNRAILAVHPLWLFSSGPISQDTHDDAARKLREGAVKKEIAGLATSLGARDHHVFFGALDRGKLRVPDKWFASIPAFPGSEGDFRDWDEIDAWSTAVAEALSPVLV